MDAEKPTPNTSTDSYLEQALEDAAQGKQDYIAKLDLYFSSPAFDEGELKPLKDNEAELKSEKETAQKELDKIVTFQRVMKFVQIALYILLAIAVIVALVIPITREAIIASVASTATAVAVGGSLFGVAVLVTVSSKIRNFFKDIWNGFLRTQEAEELVGKISENDKKLTETQEKIKSRTESKKEDLKALLIEIKKVKSDGKITLLRMDDIVASTLGKYMERNSSECNKIEIKIEISSYQIREIERGMAGNCHITELTIGKTGEDLCSPDINKELLVNRLLQGTTIAPDAVEKTFGKEGKEDFIKRSLKKLEKLPAGKARSAAVKHIEAFRQAAGLPPATAVAESLGTGLGIAATGKDAAQKGGSQPPSVPTSSTVPLLRQH